MVFKSIIGATCACLAVVSLNVNALIMDNGDYTTDTDTELDWLDLTKTDVELYSGDDFHGTLDHVLDIFPDWRLATLAEVNNFVFNTLTQCNTSPCSTSDAGAYAGMLNDIEAFDSLMGGRWGHDVGYHKTSGFVLDGNSLQLVEAFINFDHDACSDFYCYENASSARIYGSIIHNVDSVDGDWIDYDGTAEAGLFLVRNTVTVPEPSILVLLLSGLIGILGFTRRKA